MATLRKGSQKVCPVIISNEQGISITSNGSSSTGFTLKSINVTEVSAYQFMFNKFYQFGNTITSVNFKSIKSISGEQAFAYAFQLTGVESAYFNNLQSLTGPGVFYYAFRSCPIEDIYFNSLMSTSFGSYTNQFNLMLDGVTGCTVHFPSNLQSVIGSWSDVTSGFGGTNTTVLWDLLATT